MGSNPTEAAGRPRALLGQCRRAAAVPVVPTIDGGQAGHRPGKRRGVPAADVPPRSPWCRRSTPASSKGKLTAGKAVIDLASAGPPRGRARADDRRWVTRQAGHRAARGADVVSGRRPQPPRHNRVLPRNALDSCPQLRTLFTRRRRERASARQHVCPHVERADRRTDGRASDRAGRFVIVRNCRQKTADRKMKDRKIGGREPRKARITRKKAGK